MRLIPFLLSLTFPVGAMAAPNVTPVEPLHLQTNFSLQEDPLVTIVLQNARVGDVIRALTAKAGLNLIADTPALDKTISNINLHNVPLSQCFALILKMGGLVGRRIQNTLYVTDETILAQRKLNEPLVQSFRLGNAKPDDVATTLKTILGNDVKIVVDKRINSVLVIGDRQQIALAEQVIPTLDKALPQVMMDVKLVGISSILSRQLGVQYGFAQGKVGGAFGNTQAGAPGNPGAGDGETLFTFNALGDFTANFNARLNALIRESKARVLSNPRVAAQDNVSAHIEIADQVPIVQTQFQGAQAGNNVTATQTVTFQPIGEILNITPHIDPEGGYVTMELKPEISVRGREVIVNGNPVPEIQKRSVTTTMRVRDGESIVIGGLVRRTQSAGRSKVPVLGDIPILGALFTNWSNNEDDTEILIVVTPHITTESGKNPDKRFDVNQPIGIP